MLMNEQLEKVASALRRRGFEAVVFDTREQAVAHILRELGSAQEIGMGGSATLAQLKLDTVLREAGHTVHWHQGAPKEEGPAIRRAAMCAQSYFASANAVTEAGEILNVDGNANRVAAITFGPASVILVVGCNKIVKDLAAADARVKAVAAPANAKRLSCKTPCAVTGQCENCQSPGRICCTYVLHRYQRVPGRIKVILVGQELGY